MPAIHSFPVSAGPVPVAIYTRVSTTEQVGGRFDSCEAQAAVCRDFLRKRAEEGWHEVACHTDAAYSGGTMNRPGIRALQRQIEAGEVKVVLIYKLERVLRNTDEWGPFRALLQKHGCRLVSTTEDLTDETPSGRLKNNLLVSVAEYERLNTAEKIRSKLAEQAKRGLWNGGQVPFGYNYDPAAKTLHPHQAEAAVVRRIYEAAARLVSLTKLANQLNAEGLRTRQRIFRMRDGAKVIVGGKRFRSDAIRHMIQRPVYAGRVRLTGREYPGQHEALVSNELWEAANAAVGKFLQPDHRRLHARDKHFHLLKGVACCGHCGRAMVPAPSGKRDAQGRPYRYYVCGQSQKERADSPCTVRHVAASVLESAVLGFLGEYSRQPGLLQRIVERSAERGASERAGLRRRLALTDRNLADVTQRLRNCAELLTRGGLASLGNELREQAEAMQEEKQRLLVERERMRQDLAVCESGQLDAGRVRQSLDRFSELVARLAQTEQRDLIALFLEKVEVHAASLKDRPSSGLRHLELRLRLRASRLVEGMESRVVAEQHASGASTKAGKVVTIPFTISFGCSRAARPVTILAPFRCVLNPGAEQPKTRALVAAGSHPIHRAGEWKRQLEANSALTQTVLARQNGVSAATVTQYLKLLSLAPEIQTRLLRLSDPAELLRYSLSRMTALAELTLADQLAHFEPAAQSGASIPAVISP